MPLYETCASDTGDSGTLEWFKNRITAKKSKPKCEEFRPIALTDVSYKIFMGMVRGKLFEHMDNEKCIMNLQAGFTKGKRLEDNILILKYCIEESHRMKRALILCAIDFAKAFDSIDQRQIMLTMIKYRCDPNLIELVSQVYTGDHTTLYVSGKELGKVDVSSGIRQGCTGSPWIFVMLVNTLIERVILTRVGFKNELVKIPVLMFADDGMLMAYSVCGRYEEAGEGCY